MTSITSMSSVKDVLRREQRHVESMIEEMQAEIQHLSDSKKRIEQQIASWETKIADLDKRKQLIVNDLGRL